jgi:hypothetical protein
MSDDIDAIMADARPNERHAQRTAPAPVTGTVLETRANVTLGPRGMTTDTLDGLQRMAVVQYEGGAYKPAFFDGCETHRQRLARIILALEKGMAVGLAASEVPDAISYIRGKLTIWGDAMVALAKRHPDCIGIITKHEGEGDNRAAVVTASRKGQPDVVVRFSVADAKRAGLWGQRGPWSSYPDRMLQQRARGFAIRDQFPDALMGLISTEEVLDYQDEPARAAPRPQELPVAAKPVTEAPTAAKALEAIRRASKP